MIRKTAFLVTGTVTGLVAVLSYNPPKLNNAIASGVETAQPSTTTSDANTSTQNASAVTPVQPQPKKSAASTAQSSQNSSNSNSATNNNSSASEQPATAADTPSQTPTPTTKQNTGTSGTFKGETSQTRWGPVQVQITVSNGKITDVSTLQYPNGDRRSMMISQQVIPWLQQEVLSAQSGDIS
ncbi:MAG: hypothetical protein EBZ85_02775, partial [Actinobacteria bacterium]|nr:hypothetical protein [Actinomycetota bacterium]